jgi:phosphoenolpyruvate phosphomutase
MIHSRCDDASEVREFCRAFRHEFPDVVVVVVPTTYDDVTEGELGGCGADVVIYANHLLRAAYPAMMGVAQDILRAGRASVVRDRCLSIDEILALIPASMM